MTTSGTYVFTVTRDQLIRQAMLNIRKLDEDEVPTATQTNDCAFQLNMLVKQLMGKADFAPGLKVWTRRRGHLFLSTTAGVYTVGPGGNWVTNPNVGATVPYASPTTTAAAASGASAIIVSSATGVVQNYYIGIELGNDDMFWTTVSSVSGTTINLAANLPSAVNGNAQVFCYQTPGTQPIVVETAILRDINGNDVPLRLMTTQEYDFLPSKDNNTNVSDPSAIYYEFQLTNSNLFIDVGGAQDVTKHIVLTYMETIQDFNNPNDNPEYPQEWYLPLSWGLSKQICPMFKAAWTPDMESNYTTALAIAQKKDPDRTALFFQPGED